MSSIIGYEYIPEHGWEPVGSGATWCSTCGYTHGDAFDCDPNPCNDADCTGCKLTNERWADCGANYPDPDGPFVFLDRTE